MNTDKQLKADAHPLLGAVCTVRVQGKRTLNAARISIQQPCVVESLRPDTDIYALAVLLANHARAAMREMEHPDSLEIRIQSLATEERG